MSFLSHALVVLHAFKCHCEGPCFLEKAGHGGDVPLTLLSCLYPGVPQHYLHPVAFSIKYVIPFS